MFRGCSAGYLLSIMNEVFLTFDKAFINNIDSRYLLKKCVYADSVKFYL